MLDLTDNLKHVCWSTKSMYDDIRFGNPRSIEWYHRLVGISDVVIEIVHNSYPRIIKNITGNNFTLDKETLTWIKLSSVDVQETTFNVG